MRGALVLLCLVTSAGLASAQTPAPEKLPDSAQSTGRTVTPRRKGSYSRRAGPGQSTQNQRVARLRQAHRARPLPACRPRLKDRPKPPSSRRSKLKWWLDSCRNRTLFGNSNRRRILDPWLLDLRFESDFISSENKRRDRCS